MLQSRTARDAPTSSAYCALKAFMRNIIAKVRLLSRDAAPQKGERSSQISGITTSRIAA